MDVRSEAATKSIKDRRQSSICSKVVHCTDIVASSPTRGGVSQHAVDCTVRPCGCQVPHTVPELLVLVWTRFHVLAGVGAASTR